MTYRALKGLQKAFCRQKLADKTLRPRTADCGRSMLQPKGMDDFARLCETQLTISTAARTLAQSPKRSLSSEKNSKLNYFLNFMLLMKFVDRARIRVCLGSDSERSLIRIVDSEKKLIRERER